MKGFLLKTGPRADSVRALCLEDILLVNKVGPCLAATFVNRGDGLGGTHVPPDQVVQRRTEAVLELLPFERPNDAEADGARHGAAQAEKEQQPARLPACES